jgi:hypothetical protein
MYQKAGWILESPYSLSSFYRFGPHPNGRVSETPIALPMDDRIGGRNPIAE